ncbi:MAG: DNA-processing protein DprA [Bacteroidales bacterium]|nr:DNA-processing protein DprA [Bacteroidales bacterium]
MDTYDERVALCALNKIFGYHPRLGLDLLNESGSALELFSVNGPVNRPGVPGHPDLAEQLNEKSLEWAFKELARVREKGFLFLSIRDDGYPAVLRECEDPPLGLYLNGSSSPTEIFDMHPMIGFVGTRDLSPYGKTWCRKLVEALAEARIRPAIVSGLALGVDGIAHRSALECGLPTIGVMATGIERIYPWQHSQLAIDMVGSPGCGLVTDYPIGTMPLAQNFLRRNRIIAGLVSAVVVVESKSRGGSLMTARYACEYGRDVYAVPGRLDDTRSAGCNSLIREQMAQIVTSPEDLVGALGLGTYKRGAGGSWAHSQQDFLEQALGREFGGGSGAVGVSGGVVEAGGGVPGAGGGEFGAGSLPVAVCLAVREHSGILPDDLATLLQRPISEILNAIGLLEAKGFLETDLLRRCSLGPKWR